jgi:hypothetical protein
MDVVLPEVTPLEADLSYPEHPIKILDQKDRVMRRKIVKFFKIQWSTTLKRKQLGKLRIFSVLAIQTLSYHREGACGCSLFFFEPFLLSNLEMRFCFRGDGCDTSCL